MNSINPIERQFDRIGEYDLDLAASRAGWDGTFGKLIRCLADDILADGEPYGPVEVTLAGGKTQVATGTLVGRMENALLIRFDNDYLTTALDIGDIARLRV